jgi:TonB-dependent SusC/RagA subfamily outer membrane receptor
MRKAILTMLVALGFVLGAGAQDRTISGRVTDEKGLPIQGVSVATSDGKSGTQTDKDGNYSLSISQKVKTLLFSSVSYSTTSRSIGQQSSIDVSLSSNSGKLEEVVVTALGIVRDKRSLGYATQTLKADQISDRGEVNIINALQGKIAGVNITGASGAAGASTNINIRGITSFNGNNQPLFIVDGIPISNDVDRTSNSLFDNQPANRALDIDPNSVESVNILKGPAAAVLYGSRASAGAIIITTKKGTTKGGRTEITVTSSYSQQTAVGLPKVQNEYGQGLGGVYNPLSSNSWGPKFGSTPTVANGLLVGGVAQSYNAYPTNIQDFFEKGSIVDNSLVINRILYFLLLIQAILEFYLIIN